MAQKVFRKTFADFRGLNLRANHLSREPNECIDMLNLEVANDMSLRLREGYKLCGQPLEANGIFNFTKGRLDELLCYGREVRDGTSAPFRLFRLATNSLIISKPNPSICRFYAKTDGTGYVFEVSQGGTVTNTLACGDGTAASPVTLQDVVNFLIAIGGSFAAPGAAPYTTRVDQSWIATAAATVNTVTAQANLNTLKELRPIYFPGNTSTSRYRIPRAVNIGGNNVVLMSGTLGTTTIGQVFGCGTLPASCLDITLPSTAETTSSTQTISFSYWEPVPASAYAAAVVGPLWDVVSSTGGSNDTRGPQNATFAMARNVVYLSGKWYAPDGTPRYSTPTRNYATRIGANDVTIQQGMLKYDGLEGQLTGPYYSCYPSATIASAGAGLVAGTYKYKVVTKQSDAQGNIVVSSSENVATFVAAGATQCTVTVTCLPSAADYPNGFIRNGQATAAGPYATPGVVTTAANHNMATGDRVAFEGVKTAGVPRTCVTGILTAVLDTAATASVTVTMDRGAYSVQNFATFASNAAHVQLFRTKNNGNIFYLVDERPLVIAGATFTIVDDVTDANVGYAWNGVVDDFGNPTTNLPMQASNTIAAHQGVVAWHDGGSIRWDDADFIERWIPARAELEVPTTVAGIVGSIISDQNSQLIVTKPNSVVSVTGSLPENQASATIISNNYRGASGNSAVVQFSNQILMIGPAGFSSIQNGSLTDVATPLESLFSNSSSAGLGSLTSSAGLSPLRGISDSDFGYTAIFHDWQKHRVLFQFCFRTGTTSVITTNPGTAPIIYYWDYLYNVWGAFDADQNFAPNMVGGGASSGGKTYLAGRGPSSAGEPSGKIWVRNAHSGADYLYNYHDNGSGLGLKLLMAFDDLDEPTVAKDFQWLKLYHLPVEANNALEGATPRTITVNTYKDYQLANSSTVNSPATIISSVSYPLNSLVTNQWSVYKLRSELSNCLALRIDSERVSSNMYKPFVLTGYEMMVAMEVKPEDVSR